MAVFAREGVSLPGLSTAPASVPDINERIEPMNNPYLRTVDWTAMSTAVGILIGLVVTGLVTGLLYKAFPKFRRPQVFFWVMLGLLLVTSIGGMLVLTPLQAHNQAQNQASGGKRAAHVP